MLRRVFMRGLFGALFGLVMMAVLGAASQSQAATIRFFVIQGRGLVEVKGTTGGIVIPVVPMESIEVPGIGVLPVVGYTDRASPRDTVVAQVTGRGSATIWGTRLVLGRTTTFAPAFQATLPVVMPNRITVNSYNDSIAVYVTQNGSTISRRLPIGDRKR